MICLRVNLKKITLFSLIFLSLNYNLLLAQNRDGIPGPVLVYPPEYGPHLTPPILMDWEDLPGAKRYQFQLSREDPEFGNPERDTLVFKSECLIDTVFGTHYNDYFWRVRAQMISDEWTDWSATWHFLSFCLAVGPLLLKPPDEAIMQTETVPLKWTGTIGSYGYDIWLDDDPEFNSPDYMLESIEPSIELSYLTPGKTYYWKTRSWHECVARFSYVWSFTTCSPFPAPEPQVPPNGAIDIGVPVELTWNESPFSSYFRLQISLTPDFVNPILDNEVDGNSYIDVDLQEGTTYFWRIHLTAQDPCGFENWSQIRQFTTDIPFICGDADHNNFINILDIVYIISFKYKFGPEPYPAKSADINSDTNIDILDIIHLLNYLYKQGPALDCL